MDDIKMYDIKIVRSKRRTIGLEIKSDLTVICRAPQYVSDKDIESFIEEHRTWLDKHYEKLRVAKEQAPEPVKLWNKDIRQLTLEARRVIPERVRYYAPMIGVTYGKITIRHQKTRWGSCSSEGNLSFNCLLMLAPLEVIDSVIVHELCHRIYMNHSRDFYKLVRSVYPDYDRCNRWLKDNLKLS